MQPEEQDLPPLSCSGSPVQPANTRARARAHTHTRRHRPCHEPLVSLPLTGILSIAHSTPCPGSPCGSFPRHHLRPSLPRPPPRLTSSFAYFLSAGPYPALPCPPPAVYLIFHAPYAPALPGVPPSHPTPGSPSDYRLHSPHPAPHVYSLFCASPALGLPRKARGPSMRPILRLPPPHPC